MGNRYKEATFFPYSLDIPWKIENKIIVPKVSDKMWDTFIKKKYTSIIMPGYLIEALLCVYAHDILKKKNKNIDNWIIPSYYKSMLSGLGVKIDSGSDGSIFDEYSRLLSTIRDFPIPIFFDKDDNVYFNMLFNYSRRVNYHGFYVKEKNTDIFWKRLLNNLCVDYSITPHLLDLPKIKKDTYNMLIKLGLNPNAPYAVVDNSNAFELNAGVVKSKRCKHFIPHEINMISTELLRKNIQCLVMTNRPDNSINYLNTTFIPAWFSINSYSLIELLSCSSLTISSDPNIYLSSAILGASNILCVDYPEDYCNIDTVLPLCMKKTTSNYITEREFSIEQINKFL